MGPEAAPLAEHTHAVKRIRALGLNLLRYGLVCLLVTIGSFKFFAFEAEAIRPLGSNSPFLGWLYGMFGVRGTAALFGVTEVLGAALFTAAEALAAGREKTS
jgi:uncharacterized membrane protein YkgB